MSSKIMALAFTVVVGIIVADVLIHPTGTRTVLNGLSGLTKTAGNQMLGYGVGGSGSLKGTAR
jgi:hypothetical protein